VVQSLSIYKLLKDREAQNMSAGASPPTQTLMVMGGAKYGKGPGQQRSFQRSPQIIINVTSTDAAEYQRQNAYDYMRSRHWPNLAGSLKEAKVLHGLITGQLLTGSDASETRLRELSQTGELARFNNLHFAAHGYLDTSVPSLSALVLTATGEDESNDGYITAGEWPAFNLKSDLLVMSACETGLGKIVSGEGVQGLPYALYVAGNRDTLLSLWQVSDNGTAVFMKRFWEKVSTGENHAQALTETKREFQRGEFGKTYTEPYYWAPFVLYGVQD
jgi:CHAT domain-containing protein